MKTFFLFLNLLISSFEQDTVNLYNGLHYQNIYYSEFFLPEVLNKDNILYTFSDSLFIDYETLRDFEPTNELHGELFDFFYYNFDIIDSRYLFKDNFKNEPPEEFIRNSAQSGEPREPCDSIIYQLSDDMFYTWFPCYEGPIPIGDTIYNTYNDYLGIQKQYLRIYNLGDIKVSERINSKLILIDKNYKNEFYRYIYMFNSLNNRIKSIILISQYEEVEIEKEKHQMYINIQLIKDSIFSSKADFPEEYRCREWKKGYLLPDPDYSYFYINKNGYIDFPEMIND